MLSYRMAKVFGVTVEELCCLEENLKRRMKPVRIYHKKNFWAGLGMAAWVF